MRNAASQTSPINAPPAVRTENIPRGILCMIVASLAFATSNAIAKWSVASYPVGEVMFLRSFSSFIACALFVLPVHGLAVYATQRPRDHLARGLSQSISQTFTVLALGLMPIAGVTAIGFSAPLWSAVLSIIWLKERAGPARWGFLLLGFCGVLIVTHPGVDSVQLGALYALANAIMYGSVTVAVRGMTKTESANTLLMWQMTTIAGLHALLLLFGVKVPTLADLSLLVLSGVANAAGQYFWTQALHLAPTTAVSPFYYFLLVWAMLIGFLVWGDVPTASLLLGSAIVVASGLFLLWHEARRVSPAPAPTRALPAAEGARS
jgi:drug/metabolite transporter (DMT)-like permease